MASNDPLDYRYGDVNEIPECRFIRFNKEGMSGSRKYRIKGWRWFENENQEDITTIFMTLGIPVLGQPWSESYPFLVVTDISLQELGKDYAEISVEYSSEGTYSTDFVRAELNTDITSLDIGPMWVWKIGGYPVDNMRTLTIPSGKYTIRMKKPNFDKATIANTVNKVNSKLWHGFPVGTLLFMGASTAESYNNTGQVSSTEVVYSFEYRSLPYNYEYRQPKLFMDNQGKTYNYHSIASKVNEYNAACAAPQDPPTYTALFYEASFYVPSNNPLCNTPVYAGGTFTAGVGNAIASFPNYSAPSALGGYDRPYILIDGVETYLHGEVDFETVLGIPDIQYNTPSEVVENG